MSVQLIVDGNDISSYVTSVERRQSVCNPVGEATVGLSSNLPNRINTFEDVEIYENGTKVFTGYTTCVVKARMPVKATLTCSDVLVKAKQTWLSGEYVSNGESVKYWVRKFLNKSKIDKKSLEKGASYQVYPGFGWSHMTAFEAILQTLQMCPFQIYANRDGRVKLTRLDKSEPVKTIDSYISYERTRNDGWIRNRAVVMGYDDLSADVVWPNPYLPGEVRTVAVATGEIYNAALAYQIAEEMLYEFKNPWDVKVVTIPGDPDLEVGQTIHFKDQWSGYESNCVIVSLNSLYEAETYQTELSLDERCPNFWGWDNPPPEFMTMYCATWGRGVWKSINSGRNWDQTNLGDLYVYDIEVTTEDRVWAACFDGVYYTYTGGDDWTKQSMGAPTDLRAGEAITEADLYWVSIQSGNFNSNLTYALAGVVGGGGIWVYYQTYPGTAWHNTRVV